jgi:hypothetical protein
VPYFTHAEQGYNVFYGPHGAAARPHTTVVPHRCAKHTGVVLAYNDSFCLHCTLEDIQAALDERAAAS